MHGHWSLWCLRVCALKDCGKLYNLPQLGHWYLSFFMWPCMCRFRHSAVLNCLSHSWQVWFFCTWPQDLTCLVRLAAQLNLLLHFGHSFLGASWDDPCRTLWYGILSHNCHIYIWTWPRVVKHASSVLSWFCKFLSIWGNGGDCPCAQCQYGIAGWNYPWIALGIRYIDSYIHLRCVYACVLPCVIYVWKSSRRFHT